MNLSHHKESRGELAFELLEVKTLINEEAEVNIIFFVLGLLEQELVEVVHDRLLWQVSRVLLYNLVYLLGLVQVLKGLHVFGFIFFFVGPASVRYDDGNVVVKVLNGVQMSQLEGVWQTVHQLKAFL